MSPSSLSILLNWLIIPGLLGFGISWLTTFIIVRQATRLKLINGAHGLHHEKNTHNYPVPRGGGLPIFIALLIGSLWLLPPDQHLFGILLGASIALLIGLADDYWNLSPYTRLLGNGLAAGCVVAAGVGIAYLSNPFGGGVIDLSWPRWSFFLLGEWRSLWLLADLFAMVWIISLMNIVGIGAGGIEGQYPGVVAIAAAAIALLSLQFSADVTQWPVTVLAALTAGAYLGFLPWNFYPQKIMPGYSGKSLGGYLLAVLAILSTTKVGTALVVLGVPLMDVSWSIIRRLSQGKSPVWGDRGHLHHKLLDSGWSKRQVAGFYWLITAVLGTVALTLNSQQKIYTILGLGLVIGSLLLWFTKTKR